MTAFLLMRPRSNGASFTGVRDWIRGYTAGQEEEEIKIEWKEVNNRVSGRNKLPVALLFDDVTGVARFLGKTRELSQFTRTAGGLLAALPALLPWVRQKAGRLKGLSADLEQLIAVTRWITSHPRPGINLRQLSVEGVNTKFLEAYKKTIGNWLDILLPASCIEPAFTGLKGFEQRFGFLVKPVLVRFRYLDSTRSAHGCSDLECTYRRILPPAPAVPPRFYHGKRYQRTGVSACSRRPHYLRQRLWLRFP